MGEGPATRDGPALHLARLGLVALALVLVWVALDRLGGYKQEFAIAFRLSAAPVIVIALIALAGGLVFGLAIVLPTGLHGYRWAKLAVLGILPVGLTVAYVMIYSGGFEWLPSWVYLRLATHADVGLIGSSLLSGVVVAGGLAGRLEAPIPPGPPARP